MNAHLVRGAAIASAVVTIFTWAAPSFAQADDAGPAEAAPPPPPAPPRPEKITRTTYTGPNRTLLANGFAFLGLAYVPAAVVGASSPLSVDRNLMIPVAGPWLDLANRPSCGGAGAPGCNTEPRDRGLIAIDGAVQGVGALLMFASLLMPEHQVTVRRTRAEGPQVHVTPSSMGPGGYGLAAFGSF